ncbi:MAG: aromatic-ring-hydroxylating dioxygenase subunit beta [Actinomycetota bacterium]
MRAEPLIDNPAGSAANGTEHVMARYDELARLLATLGDRPPSDARLAASVGPVVAHEARLLDTRRFEEWLDGFTDDAVLWVPLTAEAHPARDQSLYLDDRRRIGERVSWHRTPTAWGQSPPSECVRAIGAVESWRLSNGHVLAHSTFTLSEHRHGRGQLLVGRQLHELTDVGQRIRTKIVYVPQLSVGLRNPSFVL